MGEVIRKLKGGRFLGYYLRWYEAGRRRTLASKQPSYQQARHMLLQIEARVARGEVGIARRDDSLPTVQELVERFLIEYRRPRVKDLAHYRRSARSALTRLLQHGRFDKERTDRITELQIVRLRDELARKLAPATVRVTLAFASTMFSWAVRQGLAPKNPCKGVERPSAPSSLDFLSRDEVRKLLDGLGANATTRNTRLLHTCVAMALHTGLRKGELFGLRWIDIDLETRRLTVARSYRGSTKSNKTRHLRLPDVLIPFLQSWREFCPTSPDGSVFPIGRTESQVATKEVQLGIGKIMTKLGIRTLPNPWHALRHTFASHYVMQGGNLLALQKILGHADLRMTLIYAHLAPDFLDGEMNRVKF